MIKNRACHKFSGQFVVMVDITGKKESVPSEFRGHITIEIDIYHIYTDILNVETFQLFKRKLYNSF